MITTQMVIVIDGREYLTKRSAGITPERACEEWAKTIDMFENLRIELIDGSFLHLTQGNLQRAVYLCQKCTD